MSLRRWVRRWDARPDPEPATAHPAVKAAQIDTFDDTLGATLLAAAQRQLDQQFANLESLRTRAISVLGVG